MSSKFIQSAKNGEGMFNAIYGGAFAKEYAYVNGYYEGASTLINSALDRGVKDLLIYPIIYITRHMIELHLKAIIRDVHTLRTIKYQYGEVNDDPGKLNEKKLTSSHNIDVLFNMAHQALTKVTNQKFDPNIKSAILDIHSYDADGQTYRYNVKKDGQNSIPDRLLCDLSNFSKVLHDVHFYLLGVAMWVANECDERNSFYGRI